MTRIFLAAGEASGDLQASLLVRALRARRDGLEFAGVGSTRMEEAGVRLVARSEEVAVVGILEVLERLPRILGALERTRSALGSWRPDLFVPVDFPDFNFRLLPRASRLGIPVVYYISPQIWAWRPERVWTLRRHLRRMVTIFPFEAELYRQAGIPVSWVGHPLVDRIAPAGSPAAERGKLGLDAAGPVVALLPGSRRSEVGRIAPALRGAAEIVDRQRRAAGLPPVRWLLGRAPGMEAADLALPGGDPPLSGLDALRAADLALAASGTATLEAALLGRPVVVVYRMHPLTYAIARRKVRVPHIAMANLLAGRRVVPELIQDEASPERIAAEALRLLSQPRELAEIQAGLAEARAALGPPGAAERAAEVVLSALDSRPDDGTAPGRGPDDAAGSHGGPAGGGSRGGQP